MADDGKIERPAHYKEVDAFKQSHTGINFQFEGNYIRLTTSNGDNILANVPYANGFCMHPVRCAGHSSCPRSYACSE